MTFLGVHLDRRIAKCRCIEAKGIHLKPVKPVKSVKPVVSTDYHSSLKPQSELQRNIPHFPAKTNLNISASSDLWEDACSSNIDIVQSQREMLTIDRYQIYIAVRMKQYYTF